ncbi:hypothetical protein ACFLYP_01705 [Chloroflexota bacterium]
MTEQPNKSNKIRSIAITVGLGMILACGGLFMVIATSDSETTAADVPQATEEPSPTPVPTDTPIPLSPEEQLQADLETMLGPSDREVPRLGGFEYNPTTSFIAVSFAITDNLTVDQIKQGMKSDVADIMELVALSGLEFEELYIEGTFPMQDQDGNIAEDEVLAVYYSFETLSQINWENKLLLVEDIYDLATDGWIHPDLKN